MENFEYFAPRTTEEALALLSQYKEESKIIAGGQSLLILMRQELVNPRYLIDIKGISSLEYIKLDKKDGLRIGSLTTHRAIETSPVIRNGFGMLAEMEQKLSSVQTRNWGTIGGNLCHADPAGDPAPVLIVLNGMLKMASSSSERTMSVEEFSRDYFETALQPDELLTEIQVPNPPPGTRTAFNRFSLVEEDYAIVSAAVSVTLGAKKEMCNDARIALGGVGPVAMRAGQAEKMLIGREIKDNLVEEAARIASEEAKPVSDMHASAEYKRDLVRVLVKRTVKEALEKARKA